jgi:hypothetical protein
MQEVLITAQTLQAEVEALGEELEHHRDVRINRDPQRWVECPFLVVDPFIGTKVRSCGRPWANIEPWNVELRCGEPKNAQNIYG